MAASTLIVIPVRMASTRFPGKPLVEICGQSMIERIWRIAQACEQADRVVVATDSDELATVAQRFGAEVVMTSESCRTGTDRVAEALEKLPEKFEVVFNLQGDSVLTPPWVIDDVLKVMREQAEVQLATPAVKLEGEALRSFVDSKRQGSSSGTTVVFDRAGNALYFSKALLPYNREPGKGTPLIYRHIGLYAYRSETLKRLSDLPEGRFEAVEKLEQLRALENGIPIRVVLVDYRGRTHKSVDLPEDVQLTEELIAREGELIL